MWSKYIGAGYLSYYLIRPLSRFALLGQSWVEGGPKRLPAAQPQIQNGTPLGPICNTKYAAQEGPILKNKIFKRLAGCWLDGCNEVSDCDVGGTDEVHQWQAAARVSL